MPTPLSEIMQHAAVSKPFTVNPTSLVMNNIDNLRSIRTLFRHCRNKRYENKSRRIVIEWKPLNASFFLVELRYPSNHQKSQDLVTAHATQQARNANVKLLPDHTSGNPNKDGVFNANANQMNQSQTTLNSTTARPWKPANCFHLNLELRYATQVLSTLKIDKRAWIAKCKNITGFGIPRERLTSWFRPYRVGVLKSFLWLVGNANLFKLWHLTSHGPRTWYNWRPSYSNYRQQASASFKKLNPSTGFSKQQRTTPQCTDETSTFRKKCIMRCK